MSNPTKIKREPSPPRVLYLSFYFPPSRASGVYRGRATANHLASRGWEVTVCAAPLRFLHEAIGSVDQDLANTVDPRIRIERPALHLFPWEHDLRRYGRFRATMPILARRLWERGQRHLFPEPYASWGLAAVARGLRLHARRRFDVVLATGNPFASFAAAWLFHRLTGVPYVVDYRDSWTLNLFTDRPAFPDSHLAWKWERRVLSGASAAVFVNEALRGWHAERYPARADRMIVVPNGWDRDLIGPAGEAGSAEPAERRPLRFGYLGTLTNYQPVEELAAAFDRARAHPELADAELNIHGHLGYFKGRHVALMDRLRLNPDAEGESAAESGESDSGIRYRGPVSKTEVASVYRETDVLVFLAGGGRYVTSGKIFEYMASGRPIVSVHAPDIAATEVLEGYPLWFNANSLDVEELAQSMIAAGKSARDLSPELRAAARRHAETYARDNLIAALEFRLHSLIRRTVPTRPDPGREPAPPDDPASDVEEHAGTSTLTHPDLAVPAGSDRPRRVVLLSLNHRPSERVTEFAQYLHLEGAQVDLVVVDHDRGRELQLDPRIRLHPLMNAEQRQPLLRLELLLVYRMPGAALARATQLASRSRLGRPLRAPLAALKRGHHRAADAFHKRAFMPAYRMFRPWLLARRSGRRLRGIDVGNADRIVAADISAVTLGWRLARRHPGLAATTALDRKPPVNGTR